MKLIIDNLLLFQQQETLKSDLISSADWQYRASIPQLQHLKRMLTSAFVIITLTLNTSVATRWLEMSGTGLFVAMA